MTETSVTTRLSDLRIIKGARHCRIVNEKDEIVFRTTNHRDAEHYLSLVEENRRLHHLLEARGIAPHRIYRLEGDQKGDEVVIVAKHNSESVIVRHLGDGREEAVDLDDVMPLAELDYFISSDPPVETVYIAVRIEREGDVAMITANRSMEGVRAIENVWRRSSFDVDNDEVIQAMWSDNDCLIFSDETVIKD